MGWDQEDADDAGCGCNGSPYPQRETKVVVVEKTAEQERTYCSYDVFAGEYDAVGYGSALDPEPFAERERCWAVDKSTSKSSHDTLCSNQVPDLRAKRGQKKADACKCSAAKSCELAFPGESFGEKREQKGHGEVYDPVEGCADDTSEIAIPLQCPVTRKVFLENTVTHGKPYSVSRSVL